MVKVALLIGVSEYQPGFDPLPGTQKDIRDMERVLLHPEMGSFDQVEVLPNPDTMTMQQAIETLFADRQRDDLVLLYFSGHGARDEDGTLYFATRVTQKRNQHYVSTATAVPTSFLQGWMSRSRSRHQVLILDCCFSGAFVEGMKAKSAGEVVDIANQLGGEGRAVLTSSAATQVSFEQQGESVYTRYLVEGIEKGVADTDNDGVISIDELHEYARRKVREAAPAMKPEMYAVREGYKIVLAKAPLGDPKLEYRKEVERLAKERQGKLSGIVLQALETKRQTLKLSADEAESIRTEALAPYKEFEQKLKQYEQALLEALQREGVLSETMVEDLRYFQQILGLRDEDIAPIKTRLTQQSQPTSISTPTPIPPSQEPTPIKHPDSAETEAVKPPTEAQPPATRKIKPLVVGGSLIAALVVGVLIFKTLPTSSPTDSSPPSFTNPTDAEKSLSQAKSKYNQRDYQGAIADYDQAIKLKPDYAAAYYNRGNAQYALGNKQNAIADYEQAIKLKPDYSGAYVGRGSTRLSLGDKNGAIADFTEAIKVNGDWGDISLGYYGLPTAHSNRGIAYSALGDNQSAIADYDQAIKLKPDYACVYVNRGLTRSNLGDNQGAIADYTKAIQINNNWGNFSSGYFGLPSAYYNRGIARYTLGDNQGATADYTQAIEIKPDYPDAYYNRALTRTALGDKQGARKDYQKAAELYGQQGNKGWEQKALTQLKTLQ